MTAAAGSAAFADAFDGKAHMHDNPAFVGNTYGVANGNSGAKGASGPSARVAAPSSSSSSSSSGGDLRRRAGDGHVNGVYGTRGMPGDDTTAAGSSDGDADYMVPHPLGVAHATSTAVPHSCAWQGDAAPTEHYYSQPMERGADEATYDAVGEYAVPGATQHGNAANQPAYMQPGLLQSRSAQSGTGSDGDGDGHGDGEGGVYGHVPGQLSAERASSSSEYDLPRREKKAVDGAKSNASASTSSNATATPAEYAVPAVVGLHHQQQQHGDYMVPSTTLAGSDGNSSAGYGVLHGLREHTAQAQAQAATANTNAMEGVDGEYDLPKKHAVSPHDRGPESEGSGTAFGFGSTTDGDDVYDVPRNDRTRAHQSRALGQDYAAVPLMFCDPATLVEADEGEEGDEDEERGGEKGQQPQNEEEEEEEAEVEVEYDLPRRVPRTHNKDVDV